MQTGGDTLKSAKKKRFHFDNNWESPMQYESILLYQIGDVCCESGFIITEHTQKCYEISYIVSGRGFYYYKGQSYPVEEGDVFLCLPGIRHDGEADSVNPFRYFYVGFGFVGSMGNDNLLTCIKKRLIRRRNQSLKINSAFRFHSLIYSASSSILRITHPL